MTQCVVCGVLGAVLCDKHRGKYVYYKKYRFFAARAGRKISQIQSRLFASVRKIFHLPTFQEVIFDFAGRFRYDIVVPNLSLIVECDGQQHFKFVKHFSHTKEKWEEQLEADHEKEDLAEKNGYQVVRFGYIEKLDDLDHVKSKILYKLGITNGRD